MEFEALRKKVWEANLLLPKYNLVTFTWGNVSEADRKQGVFAIKPSGVAYETLQPEDIVVLDFQGNQVAGSLHPSSDTKTHLELYRAFPEVGGIVHTHSPYAVAWAQAGKDIPCYGTTHADYFYGAIPCARNLTEEEIQEDYEKNTGLTIVETFHTREINPVYVPGVICRSHGPFAWGKDGMEAVYHGVVLEEVAKMAVFTRQIDAAASPAPQCVVEKHFSRKHGPNAYYGQK
jgi:L-ribulose-5-phosphate 4-epimerase